MKHCFALLVLLCSAPVFAVEWKDSPEVSALFTAAGVTGTFVMYDVSADLLTGHQYARAETRFVPASTFKIPNSLIGLAVNAVKDVNEVLPYGGQPQPFKQWEQDMNLRDAIKASNVPVYQELARRIGMQRMSNGINRLEYGNGRIGNVVDTFWLEGPLTISAIEQTQFLARLAQEKLPFPRSAQNRVNQITKLESTPEWTLHGKTGWATASKPKIGWWVGWVEKGDKIYAFALNMDMATIEEAGKRIELGKASLEVLGVM
jgi:beta-lactamase class D